MSKKITIRTYQDLLNTLQSLDSETLQTNISIRLEDEFYSGAEDGFLSLQVAENTQDVLDEGHIFIAIGN